MTDHRERLLCAELTMLLGNVVNRLAGYRASGFHVPFEQFKDLCDGDARLARRVLLRGGWVPSDDGSWILGKGRNPLEKVIQLDVLEQAFVDILDDYRPLDEAA